MLITLITLEELKEAILEEFLNNTSKVTKVSQDSVLMGIIFGTAKVAQKAMKELAIAESHFLPDEAFGAHLDQIAEDRGIAPRQGASKSSTSIIVSGDEGTTYTQGVNTVVGNNGIVFDLEETVVLGPLKWAYVKIRSQVEGVIANIAPNSLKRISPIPIGHIALTNEFGASGGRDIEQDDHLKKRIKESINLLAQDTLSKIENVLQSQNSDILKVYHQGRNALGDIILGIATQNGVNLTEEELGTLLIYLIPYLGISSLNYNFYGEQGIILQNIIYTPIDLDFRISIAPGYSPDTIRQEIQTKLNKLIDYRYWDEAVGLVEWDDILATIKSIEGVKYVPDQYLTPNYDIKIPVNTLPRFRGFLMRDLDGVLILSSNSLFQIYYPSI